MCGEIKAHRQWTWGFLERRKLTMTDGKKKTGGDSTRKPGKGCAGKKVEVHTVEDYLQTGCMRCALGGTPECKVHRWTEELKALRAIVLGSGLTEEIKWSCPCYISKGRNVAMVAALKEACVLSFFDGASLEDPHELLELPGPNSQAGRVIRFTSITQIERCDRAIRGLLEQAIAQAGEPKKKRESAEAITYPEELLEAFEEDLTLREAFEGLTPGRKRGYLLHFSQAKQSATRRSRIAKCAPTIRMGKGLHD